jgi:hypothetical protein
MKQSQPASSIDETTFPGRQMIGHFVDQRLDIYASKMARVERESEVFAREAGDLALKVLHNLLLVQPITLHRIHYTSPGLSADQKPDQTNARSAPPPLPPL